MRDAGRETNPDEKADVLALAEQVGSDHAVAAAALKAYIDQYGKTRPLAVAEMYAVRRQPDAMFQWLQRGVTQHDADTMTGLLPDTLLLPYHDDPRALQHCASSPGCRCRAQHSPPLPSRRLVTDSALRNRARISRRNDERSA